MQIEILIRKNLYSETYHHSFSKQFITVGTLKWYKYLIAPYIIATESSIKVKRIRKMIAVSENVSDNSVENMHTVSKV